MRRLLHLIAFVLVPCALMAAPSKVKVGSEMLFTEDYAPLLKGKKVGLVTNHTAVTSQMQSTIDLLKKNAKPYGYTLVALFAPEHGIKGLAYAGEEVTDDVHGDGLPTYSLHGKTQRPTEAMLKMSIS